MQTKYITLDEFMEYFPETDLRLELGSERNALAFLLRLENRLETYIDAKFNRNITKEYPHFTEYQKQHYKLALLEQAIYIFRVGDISVDSGYERERGQITPLAVIDEVSIAPNCKQNLILCGIWNRHLGFNKAWWW